MCGRGSQAAGSNAERRTIVAVCLLIAKENAVCLLIAKENAVCLLIAKEHAVCLLIAKKHAVCLLIAKEHAVCLLIAKEHAVCLLIAKEHAVCLLIAKEHRNMSQSLFHNWLILSDLARCSGKSLPATIWHYDMPSHIISLKKAISKRATFCLNAAPGMSHAVVLLLVIYVSTTALLCNTQYLYTFDSDV